jgi:hypothetical protein
MPFLDHAPLTPQRQQRRARSRELGHVRTGTRR